MDRSTAAQGRGEIHSPGDGNHTPQQSNERSAATAELCPSCGGDAGDNWFDRSFCPCEPGLGTMHTRCVKCGHALDGCGFEDGSDDCAGPPDRQDARSAAQTRMIRVLTLPDRQDKFLVRMGDRVAMDVPCGRVTLELSGGWSESGIGYCHLTYEPIRQGLTRFARHG